MRALKLTPALRRTAERCLWYQSPERAVDDPARLVAHILTYGSIEDISVLRLQFTNDDIRDALDAAPAGVFDARSWAYWNLVVGRERAPELPQRRFSITA